MAEETPELPPEVAEQIIRWLGMTREELDATTAKNSTDQQGNEEK